MKRGSERWSERAADGVVRGVWCVCGGAWSGRADDGRRRRRREEGWREEEEQEEAADGVPGWFAPGRVQLLAGWLRFSLGLQLTTGQANVDGGRRLWAGGRRRAGFGGKAQPWRAWLEVPAQPDQPSGRPLPSSPAMEPALPGEAARESLLPVLGLAEQLAATYGRGTGLGWPACLPACPRPAQRAPGQAQGLPSALCRHSPPTRNEPAEAMLLLRGLAAALKCHRLLEVQDTGNRTGKETAEGGREEAPRRAQSLNAPEVVARATTATDGATHGDALTDNRHAHDTYAYTCSSIAGTCERRGEERAVVEQQQQQKLQAWRAHNEMKAPSLQRDQLQGNGTGAPHVSASQAAWPDGQTSRGIPPRSAFAPCAWVVKTLDGRWDERTSATGASNVSIPHSSYPDPVRAAAASGNVCDDGDGDGELDADKMQHTRTASPLPANDGSRHWQSPSPQPPPPTATATTNSSKSNSHNG
ncbi:hypothetical protein PCL_00765 [Purpureocillium lilacinum]|uniref:Uncharacterized protein n=1 Tax=Purpureocillium lilacinum TaxID=33203 RepID=A0A2U3E5T1_PURLI|nr:hypothetical protein PCL_00765 [Purpureocillium lilacinum]